MTDLFSPLVFRNGVVAPNRCVLAAITNSQSHADGTLGDVERRFLVARAAGGFGIVTTCASHVSRDGQGWPNALGCFDDAHVPGLARLAGELAEHGALGLVQIFHGGLRADTAASGRSAWTARVAPHVPGVNAETREGSVEEILRVIDRFAAAARRVAQAGFAGVEIHGAHGYLLTQFLSAHNDREDGWGGDLVGRARLLRAVVRAVRAAVPAGFLVGVRLSPEDWGNARGLDLDESLTLARWLAADGVDFVHLSLWEVKNASAKRPEAHAAALFRAALPTEVPVFVAGHVWTGEDADFALGAGADAVAVARVGIAHPDWPRQLAAGGAPARPPFSAAALEAAGASPGFVGYLRRWRGFVREEAPV